MSVVFSAFTLSYSLFEIPSGWLGDVKGPRRVLTRIVLWWSAFTMLTAAARGFQSLVAIRFLFGAGEAGAFPNIARELLALVSDPRARPRQRRHVPRLARRRDAVGADRAADRVALGLARPASCVFGAARPRLGGGVVRVVSRPAGGASGGRTPRSSRGFGRTATCGRRPAGRARTPWRALLAQPQPLRDLRDVLRVRLRPVLLLHLAADAT